jgi:hypothetical protein
MELGIYCGYCGVGEVRLMVVLYDKEIKEQVLLLNISNWLITIVNSIP